MIDLAQLRREPQLVTSALGRRGVPAQVLHELLALDAAHRSLLQEAEALRARVKELSRQVADARKSGDLTLTETLQGESRSVGESERALSQAVDEAAAQVRAVLLDIPNIPSDAAPDGAAGWS